MARSVRVASGIWLLVLCLCCAAGCGKSRQTVEVETRLRRLATFFGRYVAAHQGQSPSGPDELKNFVKTAKLDEQLNVSDVEEVFVSPRDEKPFVVRYKTPMTVAGTHVPVLAHEEDGLNGKRFLAYANTKVEELDQRRFEAALNPPKIAPIEGEQVK